jgi:hypothetical protein
MKVRILLATSLTLAFATCAFAQDKPAADAAAPADASTPADASAMPADSMKGGGMMHHAKKHHHAKHHGHGHVAGDPAVIDHSADHLVVTPTSSKIAVPAGH